MLDCKSHFFHLLQNEKFESRLRKAQADFRQFYLSLLASKKKKKEFLVNDCTQMYGDTFINRLKLLSSQLASQIEASLPPTILDVVRINTLM